MTLVRVEYVVEDVDVVIRSRLRFNPVTAAVRVHAHEIGSRVVAHRCLGVPKSAVESDDASGAQDTVEKPDD